MKVAVTILALLISTLAQANSSMLAVKSPLEEDKQETLTITLNNQSNDIIETDSGLIPNQARIIAPQDAVMFHIAKSYQVGIQRIRYANEALGCDFYLDTQSVSIGSEPVYATYITAVPISPASMCSVYIAGNVNHLAVSFVKRH